MIDPVFRLHSLFSRYLRGELTLDRFEAEFVPLVPYLAVRSQATVTASLTRAVDEMLVDIDLGEATEDELRGLLEKRLSRVP